MSDSSASVEALLASAGDVLDGDHPDRNRIACWLTRTAVEAAVDQMLAERGMPAGHANMRSKLTCLEVAYADTPDLPARAGYAWARLSEACHQHAYELSPTYAETVGLINVVSVMAAGASPAGAGLVEAKGATR